MHAHVQFHDTTQQIYACMHMCDTFQKYTKLVTFHTCINRSYIQNLICKQFYFWIMIILFVKRFHKSTIHLIYWSTYKALWHRKILMFQTIVKHSFECFGIIMMPYFNVLRLRDCQRMIMALYDPERFIN